MFRGRGTGPIAADTFFCSGARNRGFFGVRSRCVGAPILLCWYVLSPRGLRAPGPRGSFLRGQKGTKEPLKGRLRRSAAPELRSGTTLRFALPLRIPFCFLGVYALRFVSALFLFLDRSLMPVSPICFAAVSDRFIVSNHR